MVRMNLFQRLTRCWDQLHPYNAAQVMRLSIPCTHAFAQQAWDFTLMELGLGRVEIRGLHYRHHPGTCSVQRLAIDADPDAFISEQLNTPFSDQDCPFRPFLQCTPHGTLAGIVYHHWIADSVSIRLLMREWFYRMTGCGQPRRQPLSILRDEMSHSSSGLSHSVLDVVHLARNLKTVRRLPRWMSKDLQVAHRLLHLPNGTAQLLRQAARRREVKVTDLLLCTLAEVCDRRMPPGRTNRPNLALGSIRDTRPAAQTDDPDTFGAALAFGHTLCPVDLLDDRDALLAHIANQSAALRNRRATSHDLALQLALFTAGLVGPDRALEFFRRRMPFSAGLSNVDLSRTWVTQHPQLISEYYRVSPAGPALPLVITPTTVGQQFAISLTWRKSVLSQTAVEAIAADLRNGLTSWLEAATLAYEPAA